MDSTSVKFKTVDEYISTFPPKVKNILKQLRKTIKDAAPGAEEVISYNMPAFKYKGVVVYYAAWKEHIGFYPVSSGIRAFQKELGNYEISKGTIKFKMDQPLPRDLVARVVKFRMKENMEKASLKLKNKR
jgi:uncharacterized protein YdhG (YjbR/CyaY superfamily)